VPVQPGRDQLHRARITRAEPHVESFGGRLRDELLAVEAFDTLLEAQVLVQDWRIEYNTVRPHSALGYLTPTDCAKAGPPTTRTLITSGPTTGVRSLPSQRLWGTWG
jgi:hypothetical protein